MQALGQEGNAGGLATKTVPEMAIGRGAGRTSEGGSEKAVVGRCRATAIAEAESQGRCRTSSTRPTCPIRMPVAGRHEGRSLALGRAVANHESGQTSSRGISGVNATTSRLLPAIVASEIASKIRVALRRERLKVSRVVASHGVVVENDTRAFGQRSVQSPSPIGEGVA